MSGSDGQFQSPTTTTKPLCHRVSLFAVLGLFLSFVNFLDGFVPPLAVTGLAMVAVGFISTLDRTGRALKVGLLLTFLSGALLMGSYRAHERAGWLDRFEGRAIQDSRSVLSAQYTWAGNNSGFFAGRFECLSHPDVCLPDWPLDAPIFLEHGVNLDDRHGYAHSFHPGPAAEQVADGMARSSVQTFAYLSVPLSESGAELSFCADSTGLICYTERGKIPVVDGGLCQECIPLQ